MPKPYMSHGQMIIWTIKEVEEKVDTLTWMLNKGCVEDVNLNLSSKVEFEWVERIALKAMIGKSKV